MTAGRKMQVDFNMKGYIDSTNYGTVEPALNGH